jgi:hypothetical protein
VKVGSTWESRTSKAVLLIRILVGWAFLSEGIQKFLFPDSLGVGRLVKIGIPSPQVMARLSEWLRLFVAVCYCRGGRSPLPIAYSSCRDKSGLTAEVETDGRLQRRPQASTNQFSPFLLKPLLESRIQLSDC